MAIFEIFELQTYQINIGKHAKSMTPSTLVVLGPIQLPQYALLCGNKS